ncbi:Peroxidase [Corchorus olitorius]|uniref:Peroxidase n=1 Tax=Corchorus olitorius TaxID=93759 RepID=A0A1R3JNW2_9ROSI|nr:Peroxidase [Corchorus olitorius]
MEKSSPMKLFLCFVMLVAIIQGAKSNKCTDQCYQNLCPSEAPPGFWSWCFIQCDWKCPDPDVSVQFLSRERNQ